MQAHFVELHVATSIQLVWYHFKQVSHLIISSLWSFGILQMQYIVSAHDFLTCIPRGTRLVPRVGKHDMTPFSRLDSRCSRILGPSHRHRTGSLPCASSVAYAIAYRLHSHMNFADLECSSGRNEECLYSIS